MSGHHGMEALLSIARATSAIWHESPMASISACYISSIAARSRRLGRVLDPERANARWRRRLCVLSALRRHWRRSFTRSKRGARVRDRPAMGPVLSVQRTTRLLGDTRLRRARRAKPPGRLELVVDAFATVRRTTIAGPTRPRELREGIGDALRLGRQAQARRNDEQPSRASARDEPSRGVVSGRSDEKSRRTRAAVAAPPSSSRR